MPDDGPVIEVLPLGAHIVPKLRDETEAHRVKREQTAALMQREAEDDALKAMVQLGSLPPRDQLGKLAYMAVGVAMQRIITGQVEIRTAQQAASVMAAAGTILRHEEEHNGAVDIGTPETRREELADLRATIEMRRLSAGEAPSSD